MEIAEQIKPILMIFGITNLVVKFDCEEKQVKTTYKKAGQAQQTKIPFESIEAAFSDTDPGAVDASVVDERSVSDNVGGVKPRSSP